MDSHYDGGTRKHYYFRGLVIPVGFAERLGDKTSATLEICTTVFVPNTQSFTVRRGRSTTTAEFSNLNSDPDRGDSSWPFVARAFPWDLSDRSGSCVPDDWPRHPVTRCGSAHSLCSPGVSLPFW